MCQVKGRPKEKSAIENRDRDGRWVGDADCALNLLVAPHNSKKFRIIHGKLRTQKGDQGIRIELNIKCIHKNIFEITQKQQQRQQSVLGKLLITLLP